MIPILLWYNDGMTLGVESPTRITKEAHYGFIIST